MTAAVTTDLSQVGVLAITANTAATTYLSQEGVIVVGKGSGGSLQDTYLSQLQAVVVYKIQPANPKIRAWAFTLDNHDFYVLSLLGRETLVYDTTTDQWMTWNDLNKTYWPLSCGRNWVLNLKAGGTYGCNVVVGSDTNGNLFFLDPTYAYDDSSTSSELFPRVAQGFLPTRENSKVRVYSAQVFGSLGTSTDLPDVTLSYSDDEGHNFVSAGSISVTAGKYNFRGMWRGLGSFSHSGRMFRIFDTGALHRLDGLEINLGS